MALRGRITAVRGTTNAVRTPVQRSELVARTFVTDADAPANTEDYSREDDALSRISDQCSIFLRTIGSGVNNVRSQARSVDGGSSVSESVL